MNQGTIARLNAALEWLVPLALIGLVALAGAPSATWNGPLWAEALVGVAMALPLFWRRRRPLEALAAAFALSALYQGTIDLGGQPGESFAVPLIALYSVGVREEASRLRAGVWIGVAGAAAVIVPSAIAGTAAGDLVPAVVWWALILFLGKTVGDLKRLAASREELAERLERSRQRQVGEAASAERARIARELHDVVSHSLSVISVQASAARRELGGAAEPADDLRAIEEKGREVLAEQRRLLGVIRKSTDPRPAPGPDRGAAEKVSEPRTRLRKAVVWIVPLALIVAGLGALAAGDSDDSGSAPLNVAFLVAMPLPLLWRRDHPLAAMLGVWLVGAAYINALYLHQQGPFVPTVTIVIATYAYAERLSGPELRRGIATVAALFVATAIPQLAAGGQEGDIAFELLPVVAVAFAFGRIVGWRRQLAADRDRLAREVRLESERLAREAVAAERERIAGELRAVISSGVTEIAERAEAAGRQLGPDDGELRAALDAIEQSGREALAEQRRLFGEATEPDDEFSPTGDQANLEAIEALVRAARDAGVETDLAVESGSEQVPPGLALAAYRIVQEALTNVRRHSGARRARVLIACGSSELEIEVTDDGNGAGNDAAPGLGTIGMRERVGLYGGRFEAGNSDGGYLVRATMPLDDA